MYNIKVGFSGVGNMAGAILDAALASKVLLPEQVYLYNPSQQKLERFKSQLVNITQSNSELADKSDILFLGCKPQKLLDVVPEMRGKLANKCVVSMLAGVSISRLKELLGENVHIIRVLPNTPMLVAKGATVIADPIGVPDKFTKPVYTIFNVSGIIQTLDEDEINRAIPLSSSSPAFFFRMIRAMVEAGVESGIDQQCAFDLALATMHGASHLMCESIKTPDELIAQVTSPGGTTLAALTAFDEYNFEEMIKNAFKRCIDRADELGRA